MRRTGIVLGLTPGVRANARRVASSERSSMLTTQQLCKLRGVKLSTITYQGIDHALNPTGLSAGPAGTPIQVPRIV